MPRALSSTGAFQLNLNEILVFGGWDSENQVDSFFLKIEQSGKQSIYQEDECKLEDADIFLFTGALRQDTEKGEVIFSGQEFIHRFIEKERGFETVRKIE